MTEAGSVARNAKENRPSLFKCAELAPNGSCTPLNMNSLSSLSANVVLSWHCAWCVLFGRNVKKCFCCLRLWNSFAVNTFASGDQSFTAFDRRSRPEINFLPHLGELRNFSWHSLQFKSVQFTFIWEGLFTGHEKCIWTILLQYIYIYILYIQSCEKVRTPYWIPWISVSLAGLKIAPCHYIYIYLSQWQSCLCVCVCACVTHSIYKMSHSLSHSETEPGTKNVVSHL